MKHKHGWAWDQKDELWVCEMCAVRTIRDYSVWQRKRGAHWRRAEDEEIPGCRRPAALEERT